MARVAFLGLGTMGTPMATRILQHGHALTVWNRNPLRCQPLIERGAKAADSEAACVRGAEVVITMLADPTAVDAVMEALVPGLAPGAVVVDMSTVDPSCVERNAARVRRGGGRYVDAPVSGTRGPAEQGTLVVLASGDPDDVAAVKPVLSTMGHVVEIGALGKGTAMKLVVNALGAHMMAGFCFALVLGRKLGLDPRTMLEVIGRGAFSSPTFAAKGPRILRGDFSADFKLSLLAKDQRLVSEVARDLGCYLPVEEAVLSTLAEALSAGHGDLDIAGLIRLFEERSGVEVRGQTPINA